MIVSATTHDMRAQGIAHAVNARDDMSLVGDGVMPVEDVLDRLGDIPATQPCAVICIGARGHEAAGVVELWLAQRSDLVVLEVDDVERDGAAVRFERFALHDMHLDSMLHALHELMNRAGSGMRVLHFALDAASGAEASDRARPSGPASMGPVLAAGLEWLHTLLLAALNGRCGTELAGGDGQGGGDWVGFGISAAAVQRSMAARAALEDVQTDLLVAEAADKLLQSVREAHPASTEPLLALTRRLALEPLELQLLLLALAPELDARYQHCMAVLLDDASRRVGTLGLYAGLLGEPVSVTQRLLASGGLTRWRLLQGAARLPSSDEPLRVDPHLGAWLLGDADALAADPQLQRLLRSVQWPGADLFQAGDKFRAMSLVSDLRSSRGAMAIVLAADSPAYALALLEHGAGLCDLPPLRVEAGRLTALDPVELAESALRLGRAALLTDRPLLLDAGRAGADSDKLAPALAAVALSGCRFGIVGSDAQGAVHALGAVAFRLERVTQGKAERIELVAHALARCGAPPDEASAQFIATNFPLQIDGFDAALRLAQARATSGSNGAAARERFIAACKAIAMQGVSHLADRIDPAFELEDVVLPPDRAEQLREIVANVRLASVVLDQWNFQRQLPYGRGTTALFHGASGTGKTMAAHAIAKALKVHLLRLDLSRVVSKYIGETEKQCDQVFNDAANSGAAILIDEADALFGKRSEVKDAHDRYANIEVAFLLQRIESFDGLAILTTNLRQNLDPAFLRRLRFIIEFPRPDVQARAAIWQACLPSGAHRVSAAEIGELARRIDLTGGHIRQITLRAAFLAADRGQLIERQHLLAAARSELAKLGMSAIGFETALLAPTRRAA